MCSFYVKNSNEILLAIFKHCASLNWNMYMNKKCCTKLILLCFKLQFRRLMSDFVAVLCGSAYTLSWDVTGQSLVFIRAESCR